MKGKISKMGHVFFTIRQHETSSRLRRQSRLEVADRELDGDNSRIIQGQYFFLREQKTSFFQCKVNFFFSQQKLKKSVLMQVKWEVKKTRG